jgi:hypothetical protein
LRLRRAQGTIESVAIDEATTQLMLEALFDIKAAVYEIHDELIEPPEDDDEEAPEDDT